MALAAIIDVGREQGVPLPAAARLVAATDRRALENRNVHFSAGGLLSRVGGGGGVGSVSSTAVKRTSFDVAN